MEKWQRELLNDAEERRNMARERVKTCFEEKAMKIEKTYELKRRIIESLRKEPLFLLGDDIVFLRTENHELVHDVVKALSVKLDRSAESDGFNFRGSVDGIDIIVYGMKEVPHCRIVEHEETRVVKVYATVCNGEAEGKAEE